MKKSAEALAAAELKERVTEAAERWALQAVIKGTTDAAAQLQAAKTLQGLLALLHAHKHAARRGEVRQHVLQQLPPPLVLALLASSSDEAVSRTLAGLLDASRLVPGLVPLQAAPRLLQLLCRVGHARHAAKLLREQLGAWRFSQLWPQWVAHKTTQRLQQQLVQALAVMQSADTASSGGGSGSSALHVCASHLSLLARLMALSPQQQQQQQLAADLAGSTHDAHSWLQLLVQLCRPAPTAPGSHSYSQVLDSCCELLHGMSMQPAVTAVLQDNAQLRLELTQLLHRVLHRPCSSEDSDEAAVMRWVHAAHAASLPVLWQPQQQPVVTAAAAAGAAVSGGCLPVCSDSLLAEVAVSAAEAFCNGCSSTSRGARLLLQLDAAAAALLAAAALPPLASYGSKQCSVSRFMPGILSSSCSNVLLHALAVGTEAQAAAASALLLPVRGGLPGGGAAAGGVCIAVAPAQQPALAWQLLRMVCAQCVTVTRAYGSTSSSSNGCSGSSASLMVQPQQVMRVLRAYDTHVCSVAPSVPRLLGSLRVLMCEAVLASQLHQQQQAAAAAVAVGATGSSSSSSSSSSFGAARPLAEVVVQRISHLVDSVVQHPGTAQQALTWQLLVCSYASLSVAVAGLQQEPAPSSGAVPGAALGLLLAASRLALSALRVLLPALLLEAQGEPRQQQQQAAATSAPACSRGGGSVQDGGRSNASGGAPLLHVLEATLACLQAVALLGKQLQALLPAQGGSGSSASERAASRSWQSRAEAAAEIAADAAAAAVVAALEDGELQQLLSSVVAAWPAEACMQSQAAAAATAAEQQGSSGGSATIHTALAQHMQQELRCLAAVVLAVWYGQLGAAASEGGSLAAAREQPQQADVQLLLPDGLPPLHAHAAVLAAGCPVLGQQLAASSSTNSSSGGSAGSSSNSGQLRLKLGASVQRSALTHLLDFLYAGRAIVSEAGLVAQLAACSSTAASSISASGGPSQQQQQADGGQQELAALGRLSKKLQLPLLAALCQRPLPCPSQQLAPLHPQLSGLVPQRLLLLAGPDGLTGSQQQQVEYEQTPGQHSSCAGDSSSAAGLQAGCAAEQLAQAAADGGMAHHMPCSEHLKLLASFHGDTRQPAALLVPPPPQQQQGQHGQPADASAYADVLLAAPALVRPQLQQAQPSGQQVVTALLPAHQLLLSCRCQYFEALFSQRWQAGEGASDGQHLQQPEAFCAAFGGSGDSSSSSGVDAVAAPMQLPVQQPALMRVVMLPEGDVHTAAALLHWLCTGELRVELPAQQQVLLPPPPTSAGWQCSCGSTIGSCAGAAAASPAAGAAGAAVAPPCVELLPWGCSPLCHSARVLLSLWRCAELLLLPALQAACLGAVEAAAWQLPWRCCLVLLQDCCELGAAAATAEGIVSSLLAHTDKEAAATAPEWQQLPSSLQEELVRVFVERRRQAAGADGNIGDAVSGAAAGVVVSAAAAAPAAAADGALQQQQPLPQLQRTLLLPHAAMHEVSAAAAGFAALLQHVEGAG